MKNKDALHATLIVPELLLALLLNPLAYAEQPGCAPTGGGNNLSQPTGTAQAEAKANRGITTKPLPRRPGSIPASASQVPDSPGAVRTQTLLAAAQQSLPPQQQPQTQEQSQASPREPVGTAAAESVPTMGVAASRPAGATVAPAKQRRVRSILIKTGALVAVGVAVGATMALSQTSPGRPPGSH